MENDVIETGSELGSGPTRKRKRNPFVIIVEVLLSLFIVMMICLSSVMIYVDTRYPNGSFFVDGASMWPTLNGDGYTKDTVTGKSRHLRYDDGNDKEGDLVDIGYADKKKGFVEKLKRFDIVITYYRSDYANSDYSVLTASSSLKVKRVIGLPGESIRVVADGSPWGRLYVKTVDGDIKVYGNGFDRYPVDFSKYPDGYPSAPAYPIGNTADNAIWSTIGEGEYFVCGDNRHGPYSSDSRINGTVLSSMISGRLAFIYGLCRISGSGNLRSCKLQLDKIHFPKTL